VVVVVGAAANIPLDNPIIILPELLELHMADTAKVKVVVTVLVVVEVEVVQILTQLWYHLTYQFIEQQIQLITIF
jgi:hypothetical protein